MLQITVEDFAERMEAAGFVIEESARVEEMVYLDVTHPAEEGIVMEVLITDDELESVERRVDDGPEKELAETHSSIEGLSQEQVDHLYIIDFGLQFPEAEDFEEFDELFALIQKNIKVNPVL